MQSYIFVKQFVITIVAPWQEVYLYITTGHIKTKWIHSAIYFQTQLWQVSEIDIKLNIKWNKLQFQKLTGLIHNTS